MVELAEAHAGAAAHFEARRALDMAAPRRRPGEQLAEIHRFVELDPHHRRPGPDDAAAHAVVRVEFDMERRIDRRHIAGRLDHHPARRDVAHAAEIPAIVDDRKSTRLNYSHSSAYRMPPCA